MKKAIIALLAFGAISAVAIPANADTATVIDGRQTNVTTGDDNHSGQRNDQGVSNRGRDNSDNTGTSIRSDQLNDTVGDRNTNGQRSTQGVTNDSRRNRSSQ